MLNKAKLTIKVVFAFGEERKLNLFCSGNLFHTSSFPKADITRTIGNTMPNIKQKQN